MDLFLELYGAEAGNWALRTLAAGGLYVGGGIAGKLLGPSNGATDAWRAHARDVFLRGFHDKGRMRRLLESMPVRVILDPHAPTHRRGRLRARVRVAVPAVTLE